MKKKQIKKISTKTVDLVKPNRDVNHRSPLIKKILFSLSVVAVVFSVSMYSLKNNKQFEEMGGMAEEYLILGVNMYYSGNFYLNDTSKTPFVFRPPGYVKFLDLVMKSWGGMNPKDYQYHSREEFDNARSKALNTIYFSQCLLLSFSTLVLLLLLLEFLNLFLASAIALMFGINPYLIALIGMVHYETLHIFMMLISTYFLYLAFARKKLIYVSLLLAGVLWGLTTLVRPVSLIMPALFLLMLLLYYKKNLKKSLLYLLVFTIPFAATIAPYTYRNYKLVNRFIPINAQTYIALWAGSNTGLDLDANHYRWWQIWYPDGQNAYEKITQSKDFTTTLYADHVLELEDYFKTKFKENLSKKPMTYIGNVCKNFILLNFGINSVYIKMFQYKQHYNTEINKDWLQSDNPQDFYPSGASKAFAFLIFIMSLMSIAGIILSLKVGDKLIYIPLMVFLTIAISHSITYMDLMYYYVRIPFLFIFTAFFIKQIGSLVNKTKVAMYQKGITISLAVFMFLLTLAVIA